MRTKLALFAGTAALLLHAASASAQVSVTATAGDPGPTAYTTVGAAFTAINAGTHQGDITIEIQANTDEGATAAVLNSNGAGAALYTSVLMRPTTDAVTISGASVSGRGIIELNGADGVTINGDNPNTPGTNRDLTIQNTALNTTTFTSVVRVALGLTFVTSGNNNTVTNTVILGSATGRNIAAATSTVGSEFTTYGILVGGGGSTVSATTPPSAITSVSTLIGSPITATNFTVNNNRIDACARGIAMQGSAVTVAPGLTVTNNLIGSATPGNITTVYARGMTLQGFDTTTIAGNTIQNIEYFVGTAQAGIFLGDVSATGQNATVERNNVTNVFNRAPGTFGAYGINLAAGNAITVRNNFVSGMTHDMTGGAAFSTTFGVFGIRVGTGINHKVYHNSVNLFGLQPGTSNTSLLSAAFAIVSTTQTGIDVRNNAFANAITGGTTSVAAVSVYLPSGGTSAMNLTLNNNGYYSGTDAARQGLAQAGAVAGTNFFLASNFNASLTTPANNFRAYSSTLSAAGSNDSASFATTNAVPFTSAADLHVPNGTVTLLESRGVGTAVTGVTTDIDGEPRPNGIAPDSGADEFTGTGAPANDISAAAILVPAPGSVLPTGTAVSPQANFHNVGAAAQTAVGVQFTIAGPGGYSYSDSQIIASIAAGQIVTVTFAPAPAFGTIGTYTMTATVTTADSNPANDQITGSFDIQNPVTGGSHSVPGEYPSLTNPGGIFAVLNAVGATGNVTIEITADLSGETGAVPLNELAGGLSVTIKPSGGPRTITGSNASNGIIRLNGADNVTIDGSLTGGTATGVGGDPSLRNMTVQNTSPTATAGAVIAAHSGPNGAQNNVFKNLNVVGQDPTQTLIGLSIGGATPGVAGIDNDNNRVENCSFQKSFVAVYHVGASAANPNTGSVITMNDLSATGANRIRRVGIFVFNDNGLQVTLNAIGGIDTNESVDALGMALGIQNVTTTSVAAGGITNAQILRNRINGVFASSTVGFSAAGIAIAGSPGTNTIANNTIAGVIAPSTSPDIVAGIYVSGVVGTSTQLFYNSIENTGDRGAVAGQIPSYGIAITGTNPTVVSKNNIFFNSQTSAGGVNAKSFSIGMQSTTFTALDSNFNDFFVSGPNGILARTGDLGTAGTDQPTLVAWQTAVSDDANSLNVDPLYVSLTDPHLQPTSPVLGKGTPIAGITNDIDNDLRSATAPEIGADELLKADLSVTKLDGPDPVVAGTNLTYTITVNNAGPVNATSASLSDTLPAGTTFVSLSAPGGWGCTTPPVGAGGTVTCTNASLGLGDAVFTLTVAVDPAVPAGTVISNTAAATSATADPNAANNSGNATTTVATAADLSVIKTDSPDPVTIGYNLTYTITVTNAGPSNAAAVSLGDTLPVGTTFVSLASPAGWSCTTPPVGSAGSVSCTNPLLAASSPVFVLKVAVGLAVPAGTVLTNTATAASSTADPNPGNESGTATTTTAGSASVSIDMTVDNPMPGVGTNVTFTITAVNGGPSLATGVQVTDLLPAGLTFVSATPSQGTYSPATGVWNVGAFGDGGTATLALVATVTVPDTIVNQATKTAQGEVDPNGSDNSATVVLNGPSQADVQVQKTVDNTKPGTGTNVTFIVSATNGGPINATGVEITDLLPAGLTFVSATPSQGSYVSGTGVWTVGSIANGATATLQIVATVITPAPISNTATKTAENESDYVTINDADSVTLNDATVADMALGKTASQEPVAAGTNFTYTIVVANQGPATATGVTVTDNLPAGVSFVSATPSQGNCTGTTNISCTLGTINAGGGAQVALVVMKTVGGSVSNIATVAANEGDPNTANNSNTVVTTPVELLSIEVE